MIRPWYRSRLLWLGLPGLLFLLWGWWDSGGVMSRLNIEGPGLEKSDVDIDRGLIKFELRL